MLRFVVEESLAGRSDRLKGFTIAVAVYGRDETFDPQSDPVVRLEARRLRRDLDSYYIDAGKSDPLRISIPKGSYVPHFEWQDAPRSSGTAVPEPVPDATDASEADVSGDGPPVPWIRRARPRVLLIGGLTAIVVAVAAIGWNLTAGREESRAAAAAREPALVVLPFRALGATETGRYLADGLNLELVGTLMKFPGLRLYTLPVGFDPGSGASPERVGRDIGVAYVIRGSVRDEANMAYVSAQLLDAVSGRVLWSGSYDRALVPEALIRIQKELAGEIAATLGQPYGVVTDDLNLRQASPAVSNMQSYVCVLRAYRYRRGFRREEFDPVFACLEEAVRRDPDYADAWTMLGWLRVDAARNGFADRVGTRDPYRQALAAASRALTLEPGNTRALKLLGAVYHYTGRYDDSARIMRQALERNPHDPEALAHLGWRLAVRGGFDEGIPLLERAIARTANPPGWYYHLIAIDLYLKGEYGRMLRVAERSAPDGRGVSQALIAIANGALGNAAAARQALERMSSYDSFARDPAGYLRRHGAVPEIVDALTAGLRNARRIAAGV